MPDNDNAFCLNYPFKNKTHKTLKINFCEKKMFQLKKVFVLS